MLKYVDLITQYAPTTPLISLDYNIGSNVCQYKGFAKSVIKIQEFVYRNLYLVFLN